KSHARKRMASKINSSLPTAALPASGLRGRPIARTSQPMAPPLSMQNKTDVRGVNPRSPACRGASAASTPQTCPLLGRGLLHDVGVEDRFPIAAFLLPDGTGVVGAGCVIAADLSFNFDRVGGDRRIGAG